MVSFQVTLKEPSTLISFIEMAALNTFFHPDIIGNTLASYIASRGFDVKYEDYLMDNFYREDNFSVQAQDILLEMRFSPK